MITTPSVTCVSNVKTACCGASRAQDRESVLSARMDTISTAGTASHAIIHVRRVIIHAIV